MKVKYVLEAESGRLYGPFKSAATASHYGNTKLVSSGNRVNAYKVRPLHHPTK